MFTTIFFQNTVDCSNAQTVLHNMRVNTNGKILFIRKKIKLSMDKEDIWQCVLIIVKRKILTDF